MKYTDQDIKKNIGILELINTFIEKILENKILEVSLINKLYDYINSLTIDPISQKAKMISWWSDLDVIYALALDREPKRLTEDDEKAIAVSLKNIHEMALNQIISLKQIREQQNKHPIPEVKETAVDLTSNWLMCPLCQEVWENPSKLGMVVCPKCCNKLHNPSYHEDQSRTV